MSALVVGYAEAAALGAQAAGGKAHTLARLAGLGFDVPPGVVLLADAYRQALARVAARDALARLATVDAPGAAGAPALADLEAVRAALTSTPLDPALLAELRAALAAAGLAGVPLAVRSSAVGEDGARASFAGIHTSVLGVVAAEGSALEDAVRACWGALWTPHALAYRRRQGLDDQAVACGVLVCAVVGGAAGPRAAGVAFGCDPRTGQRDLVAIEAVRGLADRLVAGAVVAEPWRVDLRSSPAADLGGDPAPERVGPDGQALSAADALAVALVVRRLSWALGEGQEPLDVEFAFAPGEARPTVVQARPVTAVPRPGFAGAPPLPALWSNANVKDALPGVVSTLGWSLARSIIDRFLLRSLEVTGFGAPPGLEVSRRLSGRIYLDLALLQWSYARAFGVPAAELNRLVGGHQVVLPAAATPPGGWAALGTLWRGLRLALAASRAARALPALMAACLAGSRRLAAGPFGPLPREALGRLWREGQARTRTFAPPFMLAGVDLGVSLLRGLLVARLGPTEGDAVTAGLLAGGGAVVSAEHARRLVDLARVARDEPAARALLADAGAPPDAWARLPEGSPFRRGLAAFLEDYGHRAVYEGELRSPRWREDPRWLLAQVAAHVARDPGDPRGAGAAARAAAEARLAAQPWWVRGLARRWARGARETAARREAAKSVLVALAEPMRALALEVGRRLVAAGHLARTDDVFDLAAPDLEAWLDGRWDGRGAGALAASNAARDAAHLAGPAPPDVVAVGPDGAALDLTRLAVAPAPATAAAAPLAPGDRRLVGIAASPGRVTATARVLARPEEGGALEPGDVLVAPSTDPGWTPLFLRASAVVMQTGGYLSHGAVVARELGLPAVVNVEPALREIRSGARLTVDGARGEVVLHPA